MLGSSVVFVCAALNRVLVVTLDVRWWMVAPSPPAHMLSTVWFWMSTSQHPPPIPDHCTRYSFGWITVLGAVWLLVDTVICTFFGLTMLQSVNERAG